MTSINLLMVLGLCLPVVGVISGISSVVVNRYVAWSYGGKLGFAMLWSISLAFCGCVIVFALLGLPPSLSLYPYTGSPALICILILNIALIKKEEPTG